MGMLYVLDEPSIGLTSERQRQDDRDLAKVARTSATPLLLLSTMKAQFAPPTMLLNSDRGPGIHGGHVVVQGELETVLDCPESLTGLYMSGRREIPLPKQRRNLNGTFLSIYGCQRKQFEKY